MIVAGLMRVKTDWQMLAMRRHVRQLLILGTGRVSEELANQVSEVPALMVTAFVEEHDPAAESFRGVRFRVLGDKLNRVVNGPGPAT
jgi:hypothetical protein